MCRNDKNQYKHLLVRLQKNTLWLTLNRPDVLNALNSTLWRELYSALQYADTNKDVRAVVITGVGRAFSAGDDVKEVTGFKSDADVQNFILNIAAPTVQKIITLQKPVIAAVNGLAYGGGCELCMVCDIVIASEKASFAVPECRIGAYPPIASVIGSHIIGRLNTGLMVFTGDAISAQDAERIGLVSKVVPAEMLGKTVQQIAEKITNASPTAIATTKRILNKALMSKEFEDALHTLVNLLKSADAKEGHSAFIEKRLPKWAVKQSQFI
jgi:enoyl-CoA hydratase/3-hydroxyacyl-CoA dehydrogenase